MPRMILIGNLISAVASVFLALSCVVNDRKKAYLDQMLESALLVVSSVFFGAWVRLISQAFGVARNYLVMKDKFTVPLMVLFTVASVALGLVCNTEGWLGLLVIAATIQLTVCNYYCKSLRATKIAFLVNVFLWGLYSYLILDIAYGLANTAIFLAGLVSLIRYEKSRRKTE